MNKKKIPDPQRDRISGGTTPINMHSACSLCIR